MKLRRLYRHVREEPGQAVVEMALVLPILMLIILGIFKFGIVYNNYLQLTDATRSGARELAVERGQGTTNTPCDRATSALAAAASALGNTITVTMYELPDPVTQSPTTPDPSDTYSNTATAGVAGTVTTVECPVLASGSAITVKASYPCDLTFLGYTFLPNCHINTQATEQVE